MICKKSLFIEVVLVFNVKAILNKSQGIPSTWVSTSMFKRFTIASGTQSNEYLG